jgi:hypothetical protein
MMTQSFCGKLPNSKASKIGMGWESARSDWENTKIRILFNRQWHSHGNLSTSRQKGILWVPSFGSAQFSSACAAISRALLKLLWMSYDSDMVKLDHWFHWRLTVKIILMGKEWHALPGGAPSYGF